MEGQEHLLYDSGKLTIWLRLPIALGGAFILWVSANELSSYLFGYDLGLHMSRQSGSPLLGFVLTLGLGLFLFSIWFLRNTFYFDAARREIIVRHSGLFGRSVRRIPVADADGVFIRRSRGISGESWNMGIQYKSGRQVSLAQLNCKENKDALTKALSETAQLPILADL